MRHPVSGAPITERDYFRGGFPIHLVGVLGGLVWGLGNGINLVAAGRAGAAISYGLGQGATLVSALWGILVWKEFRGSPKKAAILNFVMFVLFVAGLGLIILAGLNRRTAERTISLEEFRDRMMGAWLGQSVGVAYGWPTEFTCNGIAAPASSHPKFHPTTDDIDYQIEADFSGILAPGLPQAAVGVLRFRPTGAGSVR